MTLRRLLFLFIIAASLLAFRQAPQSAPPVLPSHFFGTVSLNGENVPSGTKIKASINGKVVKEQRVLFDNGISVYYLTVDADVPETNEIEGGVEGDIVHFYVGNLLAPQTTEWHSDGKAEVNLTVTGVLERWIYLPVMRQK